MSTPWLARDGSDWTILADGFETLWEMRPGQYTFEAVGVDRAGREVRSAGVTVQVVGFE